MIAISEKAENKSAVTRIHKTFIYVVRNESGLPEDLLEPAYTIVKIFDTHKHTEKFTFRVKGAFYLVRDDLCYVVHFCHSLRIDVLHKKLVSY